MQFARVEARNSRHSRLGLAGVVHGNLWCAGVVFPDFLPMMAILFIMNVVTGRLITRLEAKTLMVAGLSLAALGYLLLLPLRADGAYRLLVAPRLIAASGIALVVPTITNVALASVETSRAGLASGVLNSARQIGGMLGVAVFGFFVRNTAPDPFMRDMHLSITAAVMTRIAGIAMPPLRNQSGQARNEGKREFLSENIRIRT